MSIIPLHANHPFGPEEIEILTAAFDDAWDTIRRSGSTFASPRYEQGARDVVAKRIIEVAKCGVMNRQQLCADAVAYLANSYKEERAPDTNEEASRGAKTLTDR